MSKSIRSTAIALTVAALAAPSLAFAESREMKACFEAFTAEHLPQGPAISLEVESGIAPGVQVLSLARRQTVVIDLTATHPESGEVLASAVCRIRPNGAISITPSERSDLLAAN